MARLSYIDFRLIMDINVYKIAICDLIIDSGTLLAKEYLEEFLPKEILWQKY